jgi:hypothetical protein
LRQVQDMAQKDYRRNEGLKKNKLCVFVSERAPGVLGALYFF